MLRWAVTACFILSPLFVDCAPQSAHSSRYETEQEYTDSPDAKLVSSYPEVQRTTASKAFAKPHKAQHQRIQVQHANEEQPYQSSEQYQQYQTDYRASTPAPAAQYEQQQNQYQPQYINQAKYAEQQATRHEHRPSSTTFIPIIRLEKTQALDGSYQQSWETGNSIIASENGYLKHLGDDQDALVQTGNYSYTAPDGTFVWNSYISDESGFRVIGSHLPTPPPIPEEIQKGLDQIYEGIRQQQEAEAREAKSGKKKPVVDEDNSVNVENYPQSDNYPPQFRYYQNKQQPQQYEPKQEQQLKEQYRQQPLQQVQNQERPATFRPIVAQSYRQVQKVQRPQTQQYQPVQHSQPQIHESQRIQEDQKQSQPEEDEQ